MQTELTHDRKIHPSRSRLSRQGRRATSLRPAGNSITVMRFAALVLAMVSCVPALAHDRLADGSPVPDWIKKSCCGPQDYHPLTPDQVQARPDGWHVAGYNKVVPYGKELPSPDGTYAGFWLDYGDGTQSPIYCLFVPPSAF